MIKTARAARDVHGSGQAVDQASGLGHAQHRWWFAPVALGLVCIQLDFFALTLALPHIARSFDLSTTDAQWLISGYLLCLGAFLVPAGRLSDVIGRRTAFRGGVAVFGLTSAACAISTAMPLLVAARCLQGMGAALIWPTAMAIISNSTSPAQRGRVTGAVLGIAGAGTALGPVVGGVVAGTLGWRWVFWINVPVTLLTLYLARNLVNSSREGSARSLRDFDWRGVVLFAAGISGITIGLDQIDAQGFRNSLTLTALGAGVLLLTLFAWAEMTCSAPLISPSLFTNTRYTTMVAAGIFGNASSNAFLFGATIYLQDVRHLSALVTGPLFVVASLGIAASGPLAGRLNAVRNETILAVGCAGSALALLALAHVTWLPAYVPLLGLAGLLSNLVSSAAQIGIQTVFPPSRSAEATGTFLTAMMVTGGLAIVIVSGIANGKGRSAPTAASISTSLTVMAAAVLTAAVLVVLVCRRASGPRVSQPARRSELVGAKR